MTRHFTSTTALLLALLCLSACSGTPEQKEANYLKRGDKYLAAGKFEKARVEFRNALKQKPTDANAIYHLGLVDDAQGNFRDAFVAYSSAEQQDAHFHPVLLKLAEYLLAGDQFAAANERIDAVLADDPNNPDARSLLAARFLRQKLYPEAENEARKALQADPNNVLAYGVLSGIYTSLDQKDKAAAIIEEGVSRNPKNETLLSIEGRFYIVQGDLAHADQAYQKLFALTPLEEKYRIELADAYVRANKLDEAENVLRAGVAAMPEDWDMKRRLIGFLTDHRTVAAAEKQLRTFIKEAPDHSEPVDWLVELFLTHDMTDQANQFLDQIISQSDHDQLWIHAMTAKAKVEYVQHNTAGALQLVGTVLQKDPNNIDAQFVKAHVEAENADYDQATIDLRNIIRDRPKAKEAYELLSEILLKEGRTDLAIDTLNQLSDVLILSEAQQVRLAQIYALNGDPKKARELLLSATKTDPTYPVVWEMTARLALDLKDTDTADAAINTLDALPGQHMTALLLRGEELAVKGKYNEAIEVYKNVIAADQFSPQSEHALAALVPTYGAAKELPDAIRYLQSLQLTPLVDTYLGKCYLASDDVIKATASFDAAIAAHAKFQDPYIERAQIAVRQQKLADALKFFQMAATIDPGDLRAPLAEAQLAEQLGDTQTSLKIYTELQNAHSESDVIANNLAELIADYYASDTVLMDKARQLAERFTAAQTPYLLDTLGWVYLRAGRTQDALAVLDRAALMSGDLPPQFHYHYGAALAADGQNDKAATELSAATIKGVSYPGHQDAEKLLASLPKSQP